MDFGRGLTEPLSEKQSRSRDRLCHQSPLTFPINCELVAASTAETRHAAFTIVSTTSSLAPTDKSWLYKAPLGLGKSETLNPC